MQEANLLCALKIEIIFLAREHVLPQGHRVRKADSVADLDWQLCIAPKYESSLNLKNVYIIKNTKPFVIQNLFKLRFVRHCKR